ncbi:alpha,alpha-trehalase TreF [Pontibacter sp. BT310]|uniref:Alpha,alpha-trehalase TreF n=1 Tax=Pontibacter populi TaxID=890055 RepID=A0ABS6X8P2_9BACT|nr:MULTISPECIES: alpha,alpha-trehalase TreF [Pontibacter]MBJ6117020.1 alpha,alpha-trehalase TreF [Pontibacter sp. BT310]MBR0569444.1 alpha,alpha-trehalase TreF [Microvirga sp. STS03]MBW3363873.1 alpha,alpha-trehalase TreF [Pontibacter populi]
MKQTCYILKLYLLLVLPFSLTLQPAQAQQLYYPAQDLGKLFEQVQLQRVFPDSKTFPDCVPLSDPKQIVQAYEQQKQQPGFELKAFVLQHFRLPQQPDTSFTTNKTHTVTEHIERLWPELTRQPGEYSGSLIVLPHAYVVPGGRFREIYYWDSFFTMLGLQTSGKTELIQNMVDNFTHLIQTTGHIPNGNRTYYLSRSQPPFYALMLRVLAQQKGRGILLNYRSALKKEYAFWMDGAEKLTVANPAHRRVVLMPDGSILNRYWDDNPQPRPESYLEDVELAKKAGRQPEEIYREIRAAAESGWDFSTRWFADGKDISTIQTTSIIPVDLNALLFHMELTLQEMALLAGNKTEARQYEKLAKARRDAVLKYNWNAEHDFFYDYNYKTNTTTNIPSLAAVYPLYFNMAKRKQAKRVAQKIKADFISPGGVVTTLNQSGQQWDAPNGWAPLQWMTIQALRNYGFTDEAATIATSWVQLNTDVYQETGKLMEKYNVENLGLPAGGGEYPNQDGFGWTNGVLLKLISLYPELQKITEAEPELQH